jgi:hypothetical protein
VFVVHTCSLLTKKQTRFSFHCCSISIYVILRTKMVQSILRLFLLFMFCNTLYLNVVHIFCFDLVSIYLFNFDFKVLKISNKGALNWRLQWCCNIWSRQLKFGKYCCSLYLHISHTVTSITWSYSIFVMKKRTYEIFLKLVLKHFWILTF